MKLWDLFLVWAVRHWVRNCPHPPGEVTYDIREQAISDEEWPIKYCNRCGAVKAHPQPWRLPAP